MTRSNIINYFRRRHGDNFCVDSRLNDGDPDKDWLLVCEGGKWWFAGYIHEFKKMTLGNDGREYIRG